jgi:hypothetical protein
MPQPKMTYRELRDKINDMTDADQDSQVMVIETAHGIAMPVDLRCNALYVPSLHQLPLWLEGRDPNMDEEEEEDRWG